VLGDDNRIRRRITVFFRPDATGRVTMGFGSYDESEQRDQNVDADGIDEDSNMGGDFEGELRVESDADTDELLDRLDEMKGD
jgi:hypothetical protein